MHHVWVIDVLADLRQFARQNDLPDLAEQLDDTVMVAAAEIARKRCERSGDAAWHDAKPRNADLEAAAGLGT